MPVFEHLAHVYIEYSRSQAPGLSWAWDEVEEIVHGVDAETAWTVIVALVKAASGDKNVLGFIGAGPLEDALRLHAALLLDRAEEEARLNPGFAEALRVTRYPGHEL